MGKSLHSVPEKKQRAVTAQRFQRLLRIQQQYESEAAKGVFVFRRIWRVADQNARLSHQVADGQTVDIAQPFLVAGEALFLPSDTINGSPGNTFNCRCRVDYQRFEQDPQTGVLKPSPITRGNKAILTDPEVATIVFNETASLSGSGIENARKALAHAVMNADERLGLQRNKTRGSASETITRVLSTGERLNLQNIRQHLLPLVRDERRNGIDGANGKTFFNFRDLHQFGGDPGRMMAKPRFNASPEFAFGPFNNSNPSAAQKLGPKDIYAIIYDQ